MGQRRLRGLRGRGENLSSEIADSHSNRDIHGSSGGIENAKGHRDPNSARSDDVAYCHRDPDRVGASNAQAHAYADRDFESRPTDRIRDSGHAQLCDDSGRTIFAATAVD
jgi:hypothetical protein